MSREQEIEELTAAIIEYHCYQHGCDDCGWKHSRGGCEEEPIYRDLARHLIEDAGYRKIIPNVDFVVRAGELATMREKAYNEGRKETIKRVCQALYDICTREDNPWEAIEICKNDVLEWAEKNGVEV